MKSGRIVSDAVFRRGRPAEALFPRAELGARGGDRQRKLAKAAGLK